MGILDTHQKLLGDGGVFQRALTIGVVIADGLAVARRLRQTHGTRDGHLEEHVGVIFAYLVNNLSREGETAVVHR